MRVVAAASVGILVGTALGVLLSQVGSIRVDPTLNVSSLVQIIVTVAIAIAIPAWLQRWLERRRRANVDLRELALAAWGKLVRIHETYTGAESGPPLTDKEQRERILSPLRSVANDLELLKINLRQPYVSVPPSAAPRLEKVEAALRSYKRATTSARVPTESFTPTAAEVHVAQRQHLDLGAAIYAFANTL